MKAEKSNVIQFPTERRKAEVEEERMDIMLQNEDDAINVPGVLPVILYKLACV